MMLSIFSPSELRPPSAPKLRDDKELYAVLRTAVKRGEMPRGSLRIIERAYRQAWRVHYYDKPRKSGEPYIIHPVAVVHRLVIELGVRDVAVIVVAYLHDAVENQLERMLPFYGYNKALAVKRLELKYWKYGKRIIENLRIVTKAPDEKKDVYLVDVGVRGDWPATLVKLLDRDHNVETIYFLDLDKQVREAQMTLDLFPAILAAYLARCPESHKVPGGIASKVEAIWNERIKPRCELVVSVGGIRFEKRRDA